MSDETRPIDDGTVPVEAGPAPADEATRPMAPGLLPGGPPVSSSPPVPPVPAVPAPESLPMPDHAPAVADTAEARRRRSPSVPTIVWGLVLGLIAAAAVTHQVSDVDIDFGIAAPLVLLGAGAVLVLWGIAGLGRREA